MQFKEILDNIALSVQDSESEAKIKVIAVEKAVKQSLRQNPRMFNKSNRQFTLQYTV